VTASTRRRTGRTFTRLRVRAGMTLIEIVVVLVIVAGIVGSIVVMSTLMTFSDISRAAMTLSRTMQHTYGRAAVNATRYRLVIDLDEHRYWVECSDENPPVVYEEDEETFARRFSRSDFYDFGSGLDRFGTRGVRDSEVEPYDPFNLNLEAMFDDCSEELVPTRLASGDPADSRGANARGIVFDSVLTAHRREPATSGRIEVNFFPDGFVEPTYIWLAKVVDGGGDGPVATITIEPMTGQVFVETRRLEVPRNFAQVEEAR
jgi:general secretion pathway protein H